MTAETSRNQRLKPGAGSRPTPARLAPSPQAARRAWFCGTYLRIELARLLRNRRTLVFTLAMPALLVIALGGAEGAGAGGGQLTTALLLVSVGVYAVMVSTTSVASSVAIERAQGWSRQLRLTPMPPVAYVLVKVATASAVGLLALLATSLAGLARGLTMPAGTWVACAAITLAGSVVFSALGLFLGFLLPSANVMQFIGPILAVLGLGGGLFIPTSAMPAGLRIAAELSPAWGVGELARWPLAGHGVPLAAIASALTWFAVFAAGAAWCFRRDTARA